MAIDTKPDVTSGVHGTAVVIACTFSYILLFRLDCEERVSDSRFLALLEKRHEGRSMHL